MLGGPSAKDPAPEEGLVSNGEGDFRKVSSPDLSFEVPVTKNTITEGVSCKEAEPEGPRGSDILLSEVTVSENTKLAGGFCKEPEPEPEGDSCKELRLEKRARLGSGISLPDSACGSSSSPEGPDDKTTKIEGVFCEDPPLKDPIPDTAGGSNSSSPPDADVAAPNPDPAGPNADVAIAASSSNASPSPPSSSSPPSAASATSDVAADPVVPDADVAAAAAAAPSLVFASGVSSIIGRREYMEDYVKLVPGLVAVAGETYDFFAVYDGHGGREVAAACADRMHVVVAEEVAILPPPAEGSQEEWWTRVMERSFERVDGEMARLNISTGSTAVVAMVGPRWIVVANCGDSRAVMSRDGVAFPLSIDHKPQRLDELARITAMGGSVSNFQGYRVLGVLAISRSLGDYFLKPYVISRPELTVINRTEKDEFLILATDGLWDVVSNGGACRVVRNCLTGRTARKYPEYGIGHSAELSATILTRVALSERSADNVSAVVVQFKDLREDALA